MCEMVDRVLDLMLARGLMADEADVRYVIRAMREPTEAMQDAGAFPRENRMPVAYIWRAMLDAALKAP